MNDIIITPDDIRAASKARLTRHLLKNPQRWVDLYDTEDISRRPLRRIGKVMLQFCPRETFLLGLARPHQWAETYGLLGLSALQCGDVEMAMLAYRWLMDDAGGRCYWGLPITWHAGTQVYPPGTMMSTTTAEVATFLVELDRLCGCVGRDLLQGIAFSLASGLHRAIDDGDRLQFSYTPYPGDPVNNSNLLVAAALWAIGRYTESTELMSLAERTTLTCLDGLHPSGGITYFRGYDIVDSYHQLFSLRALYSMRDMNRSVVEWFEKALHYLEVNFVDDRQGLLVRTDRRMYDVMSAAEGMRLYRMIGADEGYDRMLRHIQRDFSWRGRIVQRAWITPFGLVHSNVLFTRQGAARLVLGLSV